MSEPIEPTLTPDNLPAPENQLPGVPPTNSLPPPKLPPSAVVDPAPADPAPSAEPTSTGNALIDLALEAVCTVANATSEDVARAIGKAVEYGQLDLIDEAFLNEKFKGQAAKLKVLAQELINSNKSAEKALFDKLHTAAGSPENWQAAVKVFNSTADAATKEVVKTLFNAGTDAATDAAIKQVLALASNGGLVITPATSFRPSAQVPVAGLSAAGFQTELAALAKQFGNKVGSAAYNEGYQALVQRRAAGKRAGL